MAAGGCPRPRFGAASPPPCPRRVKPPEGGRAAAGGARPGAAAAPGNGLPVRDGGFRPRSAAGSRKGPRGAGPGLASSPSRQSGCPVRWAPSGAALPAPGAGAARRAPGLLPAALFVPRVAPCRTCRRDVREPGRGRGRAGAGEEALLPQPFPRGGR